MKPALYLAAILVVSASLAYLFVHTAYCVARVGVMGRW